MMFFIFLFVCNRSVKLSKDKKRRTSMMCEKYYCHEKAFSEHVHRVANAYFFFENFKFTVVDWMNTSFMRTLQTESLK